MKTALAELNEASREEFVTLLGGVVENSPSFLVPIADQRPFSSVSALVRAIVTNLHNLSYKRKIELFRAHPELAGKEAAEGTLTDHSSTEQKSLGLFNLSGEQLHRLTLLNVRYRERFGFPFIICLRHQPDLNAVFGQLEKRLLATKDAEIETSVREISLVIQDRVETCVACD